MDDTTNTPPIPKADVDLPALIARDRANRLAYCQAEMAETLKRWRCRLVATARITEDGRIAAGVILEAEDR